jgi:hypothetical protein
LDYLKAEFTADVCGKVGALLTLPQKRPDDNKGNKMIEAMEQKEWLMIFAVIAGPILAVQAQKMMEAIREKRQRRLNLFFTLMSTRATRLAPEHVIALNMIDIEFYGRIILGTKYQTKHEKRVTNAWKNYNDQLNTSSDVNYDAWFEKSTDLLTSMLYAMSQALGYDFDEVQLKRDYYRPMGHGQIEEQQEKIRRGIVNVLDGKLAIPMTVTNLPDQILDTSPKMPDRN